MWKIFYHDRTTFSSEDGDWEDAPAWGVMGVAHVDDVVGYSRDTGDFYIMAPWGDDEPWSVDAWGLMDYLITQGVMDETTSLPSLPPEDLIAAGVKFGRSVRNDDWRDVMRWMDSDPQLPRKSANYPYERT